MIILVSESPGFCFGVRRAVDAAFDNLKCGKRLYLFGQTVHNSEVTEKLAALGARKIESALEITEPGAAVLIRAHGVGESVMRRLEEVAGEIIDMTCPKVKRAQLFAADAAKRGRSVLIIGNSNHPEVIGIAGWCANTPVTVCKKEEEIRKALEKAVAGGESLTVLAQTTVKAELFESAKKICREFSGDIEIIDTTCSATAEKQREAEILAKKADLTIVIGGRNSSNTVALCEIAKRVSGNAYQIESEAELDDLPIGRPETVAVISGLSTPGETVKRVVEKLKSL